MKFLITGFFLGLMILFFRQMYLKDMAKMKKEDNLKSAINNPSLEGRGAIYKNEPYGYSLAYYDVNENDSSYEFLHDLGYQGGGQSWLGIIYGAIKLSDVSLLKEIEFDEEGDGLVIYSRNKNTLEKISRLIGFVKSNEKALIEAIQAAEIDDQME